MNEQLARRHRDAMTDQANFIRRHDPVCINALLVQATIKEHRQSMLDCGWFNESEVVASCEALRERIQ